MASVVQLRACLSVTGSQNLYNHAELDHPTHLSFSRVKVFVVDVDPAGLKAVEAESNTASAQHVWTSIVDVSDWDSQREAFETALQVFKGRIDYVFPIAGIGERRSFPNRPNSKGFEKPDLKVIEIDELGVIYTVSLAIQHFRRVQRSASGFKGKSELCRRSVHRSGLEELLTSRF